MKPLQLNVLTVQTDGWERIWASGGANEERWAHVLVDTNDTVRLYDPGAGYYVLPGAPPERIVAEARRLAALVRAGTHHVVAGWVQPLQEKAP